MSIVWKTRQDEEKGRRKGDLGPLAAHIILEPCLWLSHGLECAGGPWATEGLPRGTSKCPRVLEHWSDRWLHPSMKAKEGSSGILAHFVSRILTVPML
jgi:hypothetical protein